MSGREAAARAALRNVDRLHESFHNPIIDQLNRQGLLDSLHRDTPHTIAAASPVMAATTTTRIDALRAAMDTGSPEVQLTLRRLDRMGMLEVAAEGSLNKLNEAMTQRGMSVSDRISIKAVLARAGVID